MSEEIQKDAPKPLEQKQKGGQIPSPEPAKNDEDAALQQRAKTQAAERKNEDG